MSAGESGRATTAAGLDLLSWENLGACRPWPAFRESAVELIGHPRRFFSKMALSGGLYEPLTFLAIVLGAVVVTAFPASLAYFGLTAPDPTLVPPGQYADAALPAKVTGVLAALLPLVLVAAAVTMVVLGTLFHVAGALFGARQWEGSVSIWLYSASAALMPTAAALAVILVVSLAGWAAAAVWPGCERTASGLAQWTARVLVPVGLLAAVPLLVVDTAIGCAQAFGLDGTQGSAAAVSGLLMVAAVLGACLWAASHGIGAGLFAAAVCIVGGAALAAGLARASSRDEEDA